LLTNARYQQLRLNADFQVEVLAGKGWRPAGRFSQGTRDALGLALRLALVDMLSRGRRLPLLVDDALVHIDQQRQLQALRLFKSLAVDHQVVLFSHDDRLGRRAAKEGWNVITLDRQNQGRQENQEETHAGQLHLL
ncbi:MAG: nuclease SbcCD subunit C, partial [Deltaproteobacteria bacterium]